MPTLTVVEDGGVPGRYNISGSGLEFTVAVSGDRIDITGKDNDVQVTMSGSRANIKWLILSYVSRNNMGMAILPDPADPMTFTLHGVDSSLTGIQVHTGSTKPDVLMESTTALYWREGTTLYKAGLGGHSELDDTITGVTAVKFASISEGLLYGVTYDGSDVILNLYDFSDGSTTELYRDEAENDENWYSTTIIGDPGAELLVTMSYYTEYLGSPLFAYKAHAIARVFDTIDNSLVRKTYIDFCQASYGTNRFNSSGFVTILAPSCKSPQIYDGKVVYSCYEEWKRYPVPYPWVAPDYHHFTNVLVYEPSTGSFGVERIENDLIFPTHINADEIGIDYDSGWLYWQEYQSGSPEEYRIYRSTIALSPSIALIDTSSNYVRFVTGKQFLYGVNYTTGVITKVSTAEAVGAVPDDVDPLSLVDGRNFAYQLDEADQRIWFVNTDCDTLYGASVIGDDDVTHTLTGDSPGFPVYSMNIIRKGVAISSSTTIVLCEG